MGRGLLHDVRYASVTADTQIRAGTTYFAGVIVTAATATGVIEIRDSTSAGAGTVLLSIPAGTAAGTMYPLPEPIRCDAGVFADFTGTGTIVVLFA